MDIYKKRAEKKGVLFGLENDDWKQLIKGKCAYCHRIPNTWFGVDRVIPEDGYTLENAVSCCFDCNLDKHEGDVEVMTKRNERIASRVNAGEIVIGEYEKVNLHIGINKNSKKVCAYGNVYDSKAEASRALGKREDYVARCIRLGRHSNDIFEITEECKN
jgi:glutaredoxin